MEKLKCKYCGEEFKTYKSRIKKGIGKFCSISCATKFRIKSGELGYKKGHPFHKGGEKGWFTTERTKGNTNGFKKGNKPWNINKKNWMTNEHKLKMIKNVLRGEKHPNWMGGISYEKYPREFFDIRFSILKRDGFTCQLCKKKILIQKKNEFISVHHIDYDRYNNHKLNLITLCSKCNSIVNYDKNKWIILFKGVMENGG